jgi:hypothetical protein
MTLVTTGKIVDPLCIFKTNFHGFLILLPVSWLTTNRQNVIGLSPFSGRNCPDHVAIPAKLFCINCGRVCGQLLLRLKKNQKNRGIITDRIK